MHRQSINIMYSYKITISFVFALYMIVLGACKRHDDLNVKDVNDNYRNAGDFIANNFDLSLFHAALKRTNLLQELNGKGPFTVFAPTNDAFAAIGIQSPNDFDKMDIDSLKFVLGCHILTQSLRIEDIPEKSINNLYPTFSGTQADIASPAMENRPGGGFLTVDAAINGVRLRKTNNILFNGLLHTIRDVIKYNPKQTVQQRLEALPQFKILVAGLKKTGRWDQLKDEGPFTVTAATDDLFIKHGVTLADVETMPAEISDWFFAAYIFKNKSIYLNDLIVFAPKNSAEGAPYEFMPSYGNLMYMLFLNYVPIYQISATGFTRRINFNGLPLCNDKLANGIIHELTDLPLKLEDKDKMDALKNNPK